MSIRMILMIAVFAVMLPAASFAGFEEGKKAYDTKKWRQAISELRPLAERGDGRAMVLLGNMYAEGYGVEENIEEAFILYRRAADRHNPDGMLATATLYQVGKGAPQNVRVAILWFERAAKMGSQQAAFFYAIHMLQGSKGDTYDVKPNATEAYKWFRIAAKGQGMPQIGKAATFYADGIMKDLKPDDIAAGDMAALEFKPANPLTLGPAPDIDLMQAENPLPRSTPEKNSVPDAPASTPAPEQSQP